MRCHGFLLEYSPISTSFFCSLTILFFSTRSFFTFNQLFSLMKKQQQQQQQKRKINTITARALDYKHHFLLKNTLALSVPSCKSLILRTHPSNIFLFLNVLLERGFVMCGQNGPEKLHNETTSTQRKGGKRG